MSDRRIKPTNRWGCKPTEDVCVEHDMPLLCRHGCEEARVHTCRELGLAEMRGRYPWPSVQAECHCGASLIGLPNIGLIHGVDCPRGVAEAKAKTKARRAKR